MRHALGDTCFKSTIGSLKLMVFGILIDVPIVVGGYFLMLRYRRQFAMRLARIALPSIAVSALLSIPLIILEEQINCMPSWCGSVVIPPTLPFLLVEVIAAGLVTVGLHMKNAFRAAGIYSILGVLWEVFLGGLAGAPLLIILILGPYVWISYGFVSLLPISILTERNRLVSKDRPIPKLDSATKPLAVG